MRYGLRLVYFHWDFMAVTFPPLLLVSCLIWFSTVKMEPICSCETSDLLHTAKHYNTEPTCLTNYVKQTYFLSTVYVSLLHVNALRSDEDRNCFTSLNLLNSIAFYTGHRLNGSSTLSINRNIFAWFYGSILLSREKFMLFCCF
jgi:hypothetical protein